MHDAMTHLQPPATLACKRLIRRSIAELQCTRWIERTVKAFIMSCKSSPSGIGSLFGALRNNKHRLVCNLALSLCATASTAWYATCLALSFYGRPRPQSEQT